MKNIREVAEGLRSMPAMPVSEPGALSAPLEVCRPPKLPPAGKARYDLAIQRGEPVRFRHDPLSRGCPNCGGLQSIVMAIGIAGPFRTQPAGKDPVSCLGHIAGGWYKVEMLSYPCPVCVDRNELIAYYWSNCGLTEPERAWRVDEYRGEKAKDNAIDAAFRMLASAPNPHGWLVLHGVNGVGKSGILKALVAAFVRAGVRAEYILAEELLDKIRDTFGENGSSTQGVKDAYGSIPVLALDEVDKISDKPWPRVTIMALLDHRHRNRDVSATIFATNADPKALPDGWQYLQSRFLDAELVLMGGRVLRGA